MLSMTGVPQIAVNGSGDLLSALFGDRSPVAPVAYGSTHRVCVDLMGSIVSYEIGGATYGELQAELSTVDVHTLPGYLVVFVETVVTIKGHFLIHDCGCGSGEISTSVVVKPEVMFV